MKVIWALKEGWGQVKQHRRMWLLFYLSNLVFALVATIAFRGWLKDIAGHSLALTKNVGEFDFTFITDLIRNYGGLSILCTQAIILVVGYIIFSAFLTGGALHIFIHQRERFSVLEFLSGAATYFWRILRLALYFLLIHLGVLVIFAGILMAIGINPKQMESDVQFLLYLKIIGAIYLIVAILVSLAHTYVKVHVVRQNANPITAAFRSGLGFVTGHFWKALLLYVINLLLLGILFLVYTQIKSMISMNTGGTILLMMSLSQLFLAGRIGIKLLILGSGNALVETQTQTQVQVQEESN